MNYLLPATLVGVSMAALGCVEQSTYKTAGVFADSTDPETTPRVAPKGMITASDLTALFAKACLTDYPDKVKTLHTIKLQGLKSVSVQANPEFGDPYGEFLDAKRGVTAFVQTIEITDAGPGGTSVNMPECRISAEVIDPQADWASLVQKFVVPGSEIKWSQKDRTSGAYLRDGKQLNIYVNLPTLADRANLPEGACGNLPNCVGWTDADIVVVERP